MKVMINGSESTIRGEHLPKFADVVELIKASIDPEHMITSILVDGRDVEEAEWTANPARFGTAIVEIETGTPEHFVNDRLGRSASVVRSCYMEFRDARKAFQDGDTQRGNRGLIAAVDTARAFFQWYASLMELVGPERRARYDITPQVEEITGICKRICQQQLYQSWWALSETLEKELEPRFDKLEDFCRKFGAQV